MNKAVLLISILLTSCAPVKFKGNEPGDDIRPYVESFVSAYGYPLPEILWVMAEVSGYGLCTTNGSSRKITIDPDDWEGLCELQRKALVWHELGHCVLDRPHTNDGDPPSYMNPSLKTCQYYDLNELELDQELFDY